MEQMGELKFLEGLPASERAKHVTGGQSHWYLLCSQLFRGWDVIDCGAGDGSGSALLRGQGNCTVTSIDPNPAGPNVQPLRLKDCKTAEAIILIDVIEHLYHPWELLGTATSKTAYTFFSTPNWNYSHCENPFHAFEFKPGELMDFLEPWQNSHTVIIYGGTPEKHIVHLPSPNDSHFPAQFGVLLIRKDWGPPSPISVRPKMSSALESIAALFSCPRCCHPLTPCLLSTGLVCTWCGSSFTPAPRVLESLSAVRAWLPQQLEGPPDPRTGR